MERSLHTSLAEILFTNDLPVELAIRFIVVDLIEHIDRHGKKCKSHKHNHCFACLVEKAVPDPMMMFRQNFAKLTLDKKLIVRKALGLQMGKICGNVLGKRN